MITKPSRDNPFGSRGLLKKEYEVFNKNLDSFIKDHAGKFVLIKGDHVEGFFEVKREALKTGTKKYGHTGSYLVMKVTKEKEVFHIPSITHGLMHASV